MKRNAQKTVFICLALLVMYAPILILAVYSFTDATNIGAIRGFSLHNYVTLFTTSELADMIWGSVLLALGSALLAAVFGTLGAIGSFYSGSRVQAVYSTVNRIPVVNADVVTGFSICILIVVVFGVSKDTYVPLVIGHTALSAPFVYLSVIPKLKQMDASLYEAAMDLGASPAYALRRVVLPQISPGILSGFALAVTLSLDDYFIATYTKPATFDTISTYVVNATKGSQTEVRTALWALSTIIFVLVLVVVIGTNAVARVSEREKHKKRTSLMIVAVLAGFSAALLPQAGMTVYAAPREDEVITLRVCNWEEYIDLGGWDEEETIDLDSGDIIGMNPMYEDFEEWYYQTYGQRVEVKYSCFGTNEELYNMLTLGDVYDIVCPSEYMIMKMMAEDMLVPFSEEFFDESIEENYYIKGVSPFIRNAFQTNEIGGAAWAEYAAGYMWGITGIVYNPELVSEEEVSTWKIIDNRKFCRRVTIKDNVRDSFFAAVGALKADLLTSEEFISDPAYHERLADEMNDVSPQTIDAVRDYLQKVKENVYSFETDSGKADMITGKVVAGYQWSGDAVYSMDQAEEDDFYLNFAVPMESTNLYFDGWVMLKSGVEGDIRKQHAAEAFINFLSIPENAVRNMYYIGYTSVISGGDDDMVFDYLRWCYEADEDEEDVTEYPLGYFFSGDDSDGEYIITVPEEQTKRQLAAQYPSAETMKRSAVMQYFDAAANAAINQMWIAVRCFNIHRVPRWVWLVTAAGAAVLIGLGAKRKRHME